MQWIHMTKEGYWWQTLVNTVTTMGSIEAGIFLFLINWSRRVPLKTTD